MITPGHTPVASPIANGTSNGDGLVADDNFANLSDGSILDFCEK